MTRLARRPAPNRITTGVSAPSDGATDVVAGSAGGAASGPPVAMTAATDGGGEDAGTVDASGLAVGLGLAVGRGSAGRTRDRGRSGGRRSRGGSRRRCRGHLLFGRDGLDRNEPAVPDHPLGGVFPRREEAFQLGCRQHRVRLHVVAVPALAPVEWPGHAHAGDPERRRLGRVGRGAEPGQDPAVVAVRDCQGDREIGHAQPRDGRPQRGIEGPTRHQPVAVIDEVTQAGGPAGGINARGQRQVVAVVGAHPVEVTPLAARAVVGLPIDDVAHDLDAGGCAPQPRPLGREHAWTIEVHAAGPSRQGRSVSRPRRIEPRCAKANRDDGDDERMQPKTRSHSVIVPQIDR